MAGAGLRLLVALACLISTVDRGTAPVHIPCGGRVTGGVHAKGRRAGVEHYSDGTQWHPSGLLGAGMPGELVPEDP